ncbi:C40 family peptidase [Micromonospora pattaloongensis]|nr:C40 family peptidase [Micromonospora pattaloongensis]
MAWSALLGAVVAGILAAPAYADPPLPNAIPDTGSRPQVAGALPLPGAPAPPTVTPPVAPSTTNPLAAKLVAKQTEVATQGQQLLKLQEELDTAKAAVTAAEAEHRAAAAAITEARHKAEAAAADALKNAAALPPGAFGSDLHDLGSLSRIQKGSEERDTTDAAAGEAARTRAAEQAAQQAYATAQARVAQLQQQYTEFDATFKRSQSELAKLEKDNADQMVAVARQQEAAEQRLGADIIRDTSIAGKGAHPKAVAALRFALSQRGKPYVWAAEGPDAYDCSGLMWAAYRTVGYTLPRVANDQYFATRGKSVDRSALLPGDLVFFASGPSWQSIHHVGMYVGGGKMVHAPNSNEVVKVSEVWWSRLYAATRVFDAVNAPTIPAPKPPAPSKPPATPKPTPPGQPTPITPKPKPPTTKPPTKPPTLPPPEPDPTTPEPEPTTQPPGNTAPPANTAPPSESSAATPSIGATNGSAPSAVAGSGGQ